MSAYPVPGRSGTRSWFSATARFARAVGAPVLLATSLTGCLNYTHSGDHYVPETVGERYPIKVTRAMARLDVDVDGAKRLAGDDRARVAQFARDYRARSGGAMIVARPDGGPNHVAAATKVASIQRELREVGVPPAAISYRAAMRRLAAEHGQYLHQPALSEFRLRDPAEPGRHGGQPARPGRAARHDARRRRATRRDCRGVAQGRADPVCPQQRRQRQGQRTGIRRMREMYHE
jgi:hypothetical protein